jgi:hypothetical protein
VRIIVCELPHEPGGREARWSTRGDPRFPVFAAGDLAFGLNICTELRALETWAVGSDCDILGRTSPSQPSCTRDIDAARATYPRYVFPSTT